MPAVHVEFFGRRLVWLRKEGSDEGPLVYPVQVDADGVLKARHIGSTFYAQVGPKGVVRRFGQMIGSVSDLIVLTGAPDE